MAKKNNFLSVYNIHIENLKKNLSQFYGFFKILLCR